MTHTYIDLDYVREHMMDNEIASFTAFFRLLDEAPKITITMEEKKK